MYNIITIVDTCSYRCVSVDVYGAVSFSIQNKNEINLNYNDALKCRIVLIVSNMLNTCSVRGIALQLNNHVCPRLMM